MMEITRNLGKITLEICAGSYDSALAALRGGAQRIELCAALGEGGLTPSWGLMKAVMALPALRKHVLIRPRGGDFLYSEAEVRLMTEDILMAREAGADGIVVGALTADGDVDMRAMRLFMEVAGTMSVTFHRAFDLCRDPEEALERIVELGCSRLLTSGQAATAFAGIPLLKCLVEQASGRLSVMPGCGVSADNAAQILQATGAVEIHASARRPFTSGMNFRHDGVSMGRPSNDEYERWETSEEEVGKIISALDSTL